MTPLTRPHAHFRDGRYWDTIMRAVLREEWKAVE
jgi:RimJ/RimL family protein N-acetyltransferase